jgi:hypothetical protein
MKQMTETNAMLWQKAAGMLLLLGIVVAPFNKVDTAPSFLGEFSVEAAFYPIAVGLALFAASLFCGGRLVMPRSLGAVLCLLLLAWVCVSALANWPSISHALNKGRTGTEKLFLQAGVLLFGVALSVTTSQFAAGRWGGKALRLFSKAMLLSLVVAGAYSAVELGRMYGSAWATDALAWIDSAFRREPSPYPARLRSTCGEASWFGGYIAFALPWLLAKVFWCRQRHLAAYSVFIFYVFIMCYLSFSRTVYGIVLSEMLLFAVLVARFAGFKALSQRFAAMVIVVCCTTLTIVALPSPSLMTTAAAAPSKMTALGVAKSFSANNNTYSLSNKGRLGSAVTAMRIGWSNPFFGAGLGQYGFYMAANVPDWAADSPEMKRWASPEEGMPWPPALNIHARIFAELGAVGLLLWLAMWAAGLFGCLRALARNRGAAAIWLSSGIAIVVSICGAMLQGCNADSFRMPQYWLLLGLVWMWLREVECRRSL